MQKAERPCRSDFGHILAIRQFKRESLPANHRMRKVDGVGNRITLRRINSDELVTLPHFQRTQNSNVSPRPALLANACLANEFHKGSRAAIEDWEFQVVEL